MTTRNVNIWLRASKYLSFCTFVFSLIAFAIAAFVLITAFFQNGSFVAVPTPDTSQFLVVLYWLQKYPIISTIACFVLGLLLLAAGYIYYLTDVRIDNKVVLAQLTSAVRRGVQEGHDSIAIMIGDGLTSLDTGRNLAHATRELTARAQKLCAEVMKAMDILQVTIDERDLIRAEAALTLVEHAQAESREVLTRARARKDFVSERFSAVQAGAQDIEEQREKLGQEIRSLLKQAKSAGIDLTGAEMTATHAKPKDSD